MAGGVVLCNDPIVWRCPIRVKKDDYIDLDGKTRKIDKVVTEFNKDELEDPRVSLLKYDALAVKIIDVLQECQRLIKQRHNEDIDLWSLPDGDDYAYGNLIDGLRTGVFQMETSAQMEKVIQLLEPHSIVDLSVVTSLCRPGPLESNYHIKYAENKAAGKPPSYLHPLLAETLRETHYVIVFQEQIMQVLQAVCNFSPDDALMCMRSCAKKKEAKMAKFEPFVIEGAMSNGLSQQQAETMWSEIEKFASYALINKLHSTAFN